MTLPRQIKQALRGQVSPGSALLEIGRRGGVAIRAGLERLANASTASDKAVRLRPEFASMPSAQLLTHFQTRSQPRFFPGFHLPAETMSRVSRAAFPSESDKLLKDAVAISNEHRWPLLGYGELDFGEEIDWLREPVSGVRWPDEHKTESAVREGEDIRVLWELNRLGHLITVARAFAVTEDERFAEEVFVQLESWKGQNRFAFGPNWSCAMEAALRAMNLLAAFQLIRCASCLTVARLEMMLGLFERHAEYIKRHLEFSYLATSNHYLSDVIGLLWLGVSLPELEAANDWQSFGLREMLREIDKQVLADGTHYESSTGYHRFVLELLLYSFILCRANSIEIEDRYWKRLFSMFQYTRAYLRPDGRAPLVGDTDSGQVMPIARHTADEHSYLLGIGAVVFNDPNFKIDPQPPQELIWILGPEALETFAGLKTTAWDSISSEAFAATGIYTLRDLDLYLLFNASGTGLKGRGSHGHNDALSLEVSACGTNFLVDPGTFVYTADYAQRHQFRSTGYHSTVEVDGEEQNTTEETTPFRIGDESQPRVLRWETGTDRDLIVGEHYGYRRLKSGPITHRRSVMLDKTERYWLVEDTLTGSGSHHFKFVFHLAPGLEIDESQDGPLQVRDAQTGSRLVIASMDLKEPAVFEPRWTSRDYGARVQSRAACWAIHAEAPVKFRWLLLPICAEEDENSRIALIARVQAGDQ